MLIQRTAGGEDRGAGRFWFYVGRMRCDVEQTGAPPGPVLGTRVVAPVCRRSRWDPAGASTVVNYCQFPN